MTETGVPRTEIPFIPKKEAMLIWFLLNLIYLAWFSYIFGILGHVCPVTFIGVAMGSMLAPPAINGRRPRFLGSVGAILVAAIGFGLAFFVFHPFNEDHLERYVNPAPFVILILTMLACAGIQVLMTRGPEKTISKFEARMESALAYFTGIVCTLVGIGFFALPSLSMDLWNEEITEWFDTIFYPGDVYFLFAFLAVISLVSGISMILSFWVSNKRQFLLGYYFRILGYAFFSMLLIGGWGIFHVIGKGTHIANREKRKKE